MSRNLNYRYERSERKRPRSLVTMLCRNLATHLSVALVRRDTARKDAKSSISLGKRSFGLLGL